MDSNILTTQFGVPAKVTPQAGMDYPVIALADPTGKLINGAAQLCQLPSAAYGSVPASCTFSTQYISGCAMDMIISSFSGGSSPTITVFFERQGADGIWYPILPTSGSSILRYTSAQLPGTVSVDFGLIAESLPATGANPFYGTTHNVFTPISRVRWVNAGTPDSITLSLSVYGR